MSQARGVIPSEWRGSARRGKFPRAYRLFIALWSNWRSQTIGPPIMAIEANAAPADHCTLTHRVFTSFGEPLFRRSETDGTPVMVVKLGEKEAAIPLRSLQREFGIPDDSDDGRMLGLIAQSLDFVPDCGSATRCRPRC